MADRPAILVLASRRETPAGLHAFATYHYEDGTDLLTLKELMGHRSVSSTAVYVHLSSRAFHAVQSPLDRMGGMEP